MRSFDSPDNSVASPKAYVGLFGDNTMAVLDTATKTSDEDDSHPHRSARAGHDARRQAGLRQQRW
jgi:hypothetical protein